MFPVIIAVPLLIITYKKFPLTTLLYLLLFLHCLILITGGKYTYARAPLGFWLQEWFDLSRNPYDRIGHLAQGFVPALVVREIFIRAKFLNARRILPLVDKDLLPMYTGAPLSVYHKNQLRKILVQSNPGLS